MKKIIILLILTLILLFGGCTNFIEEINSQILSNNLNHESHDISYNYSVKSFEDLYDIERNRSIPTTVYYPIDDGCYPLILVSHGGGGDRNSLVSYDILLASNGYVVIVPEHVRSNKSFVINLMNEFNLSFLDALKIIAGDKSEWENRPKDISFLIDMAYIWNNSDNDLAGKINLNKIGVMGHSYGAYTTSAIMGALVDMPYGLTDFSDPRVDAGLAISPQGPGGNPVIDRVNNYFTLESWDNISKPLSHHSEDDWLNDWRKIPFDSTPLGDKYFILFKNSQHIDFSDNNIYRILNDTEGQIRNNETINVSKELALRFFNLYLKNLDEGKYNERYADSLCKNNSIVTDIIWDEKLSIYISISKPKESYLYIFNNSILYLPFYETIVIGCISIETEVESYAEIEKAEFYIDDNLKFTDYEPPYSWLWNEFAIGKHEIKIIAYSVKGSNCEDKINVMIFNFG